MTYKLDFFVRIHFWGPSFNKRSYNELSYKEVSVYLLTLVLVNLEYPAFANSVDPDHLASEEANRSGSVLFGIRFVNMYQQPGSSYLIG